ncbi:hypothetical protein [Ruminococcus sp.]|uniref:DUF7601 domain-containing protein n=1 Tax=Ruminococcus sp. TaxID=41978 RepID=UPI0025F24762|nr:hypothetical protein [Ruminococcus sp.]MBQ6250461.1 hypothetical protein [Ruminococcus sp.]
MKKTMIKRMLSAASSVIMTSVIAVSAFSASAASTPNSGNDAAVIHSVTPANTASFKLNKDIILFNVDGSTIYEPNVNYTYSVAGATVSDGTTVKGLTIDTTDPADETVTVAVRSGSSAPDVVTIQGANGSGAAGDAGTTATLVFGDDTSHTKATNKETDTISAGNDKTASRALTVNIDATKFPADSPAGIYRYVITDTTDEATLTAAGIDRNASYDKARYLDVYTKYGDDGKLQVYGYVLLKGSSGANTSLEYDATADETTKVTGFDTESETGASGEYNAGTPISDEYHTFNVEIKKVVEGSLADPKREFPFMVELSNEKVISLDEFYYVQTDIAEGKGTLAENGSWTFGTAGATSALNLKDGDSILITGLPTGTKIKVTEYNSAPDTYTVSAKDTDDAAITLKCDAKTGNSLAVAPSKTAAMNAEFAVDNEAKLDTITFKNTLKDISVTGVAFAAAPFALMLLAGAFFFGMFMKNRKRNENDSVI